MNEDELRETLDAFGARAPVPPAGLAHQAIATARRRRRTGVIGTSLVSVLLLVAGATTVPRLLRSKDEVNLAASADEVLLSCGGGTFRPEGLHAPLGAENGTDGAAAALRAAFPGGRDPNHVFIGSNGWRELSRTADEVIFATGPEYGYYGVRRQADGIWKNVYSGGSCVPAARVRPDGMNAAGLQLRDLPTPESRELVALVAWGSCTGDPPQVAEPLVEYRPSAVLITMSTVRPEPKGDITLGTNAYCERPPVEHVIHLSEPLGNRRILDAGHYPPAPVTSGVVPAPACESGPIHLDVASAAPGSTIHLTTRTPCVFPALSRLRVTLGMLGRARDRPLVPVVGGRALDLSVELPKDVSFGEAAILFEDASNCPAPLGCAVLGVMPLFIDAAPSESPEGTTSARGDVDGDGRADTVTVVAESGKVAVSFANGQGTATAIEPDASLQIQAVADLDRNGRFEILTSTTAAGCCKGTPAGLVTVLTFVDRQLQLVRTTDGNLWTLYVSLGRGDQLAGIVCEPDGRIVQTVADFGTDPLTVTRTVSVMHGLSADVHPPVVTRESGGLERASELARSSCPGMNANGGPA